MTIGYQSQGSTVNARQSFFGGKSKDALVDAGYGALPTGWSHVDVGTVACVSVLADGAHATEPLRGWEDTLPGRVIAVMMRVNLSGTPTAAFCLVGRALDGALCLECGTDGKVRIIKLGTSPNRWSGRTAVSGWSASALPMTGTTLAHLAFMTDALTLGSNHLWASILIGATQQLSLDVGTVPASNYLLFCPNIDNVNAGISVRMTDCVGLGSTSSADAPHLVHWPIGKVAGQHPISDEVGWDEWTGYPDTTNAYTNWDDGAGNDGDTSYNSATTIGLQQRGLGQSAATLGISGDTVIAAESAAGQGPVANLVDRTVSGVGSKYAVNFICDLTASVGLADPGTTYAAKWVPMTRSSGSWTIADVDAVHFGLETGASSHDKEERCTMIQVHWCTYSATLPLTTTPSLPPTGQRRRATIIG